MNSAVIDVAGLHQLVSTLIDRGYTVVGPTVSDNAIVLSELNSDGDWTCPRPTGSARPSATYRTS